jgi:putative ABC transport system permease protein
MFAVVDALILRPFPIKDPGQVVFVSSMSDSGQPWLVSFADYRDWQARAEVFQDMAARRIAVFDWFGQAYPERVMGQRITKNFFRVLGIRPQLGRSFDDTDGLDGEGEVILISDRLWRSRFHAESNAVGSIVRLASDAGGYRPFRVVGVLPPVVERLFPGFADIWSPLDGDSRELRDRRMRALMVIARLRPGVTRAAAREKMRQIASELASTHPRTNRGLSAAVDDFHTAMTRDARHLLPAFVGISVCVLAIACANIANLLVARAMMRRREASIRAALGGGRMRLFRQLLAESIVVCLLGGLGGTAAASFLISSTRALVPPSFLRADLITIHPRVWLFALAVSVGAGILAGMAPALYLSAQGVTHWREWVARGPRGNTYRRVLMVLQASAGVITCTLGGLMIRSYGQLHAVDPGFRADHVLIIGTFLPPDRYSGPSERARALGSLYDSVRALPGVREVGFTDAGPLRSHMKTTFRTGRGEGQEHAALIESVGGDYFRSLGVELIKGRLFNSRDHELAAPVAIVNEEALRVSKATGDPLGRHLTIGDGPSARTVEIAGIVRNVRHRSLSSPPEPILYVPQTQEPSIMVELIVRAEQRLDPLALASAVRTAMASVDPSLAAQEITSMEERITHELSRPRLMTILLCVFGSLAVVLSATGIFSSASHLVSSRRREIGIRLAIGATRADAISEVVRKTMGPAGIGIALGVICAGFVTPVLRPFLYQIRSWDPWTIAGAGALIGMVSLLASWIPALRVHEIDPAKLLRTE